MGHTALGTASLTLAALTAAGLASAQTDYDEALSVAARCEQEGRPREAAAALDPVGAYYPQDYALSLRLGWLWSQAGDPAAARRWYQQALTLSADSSADARLGRSLAEAAAPRSLRLWASLWLGAQAYQGHPLRSWSVSATAAATAQILDVAVLGVTWRAVAYGLSQTTTQPPPPPPRPMMPPPRPPSQTTTTTSVQQELHLVGGVARATWAARVHFGHLWDASNTSAPAYVIGASGRLALRGDLSAELSDTIFADASYVRAVGAWAISLGRGWTLGPVASLQLGGYTGGSIGALVGYTRRGYTVSLGGRYGDERRPTSLAEALTFATDDRIRGALTLSGLIPVGGPLSVALRYDALFLTTSAATGGVDASAHFFTAALAGAW